MNKTEYNDMYNCEDKMWWYDSLRHVLKYWINKEGRKDLKILDAGCGTGKNIESFSKLDFITEGIEFSQDAIELCKNRGIKNIKQGSITNIIFPDSTFDITLCIDVIGILDDKDRKIAIDELLRVTKSNGIIIMHSAAHEFLRSQHDEVCNLKKRFTKKEYEALFENTNISIIKSSYRYFLLSPLIITYKIVKKFLGKNKIPKSDQNVPIYPINILFKILMRIEDFFGRYINYPFGSSIFIIVRKK
ncbi:MAG: class I SAM-dependent methyltransferase [bacterium]